MDQFASVNSRLAPADTGTAVDVTGLVNGTAYEFRGRSLPELNRLVAQRHRLRPGRAPPTLTKPSGRKVMTRMRLAPRTKAYAQRRIAEGETRRETAQKVSNVT